MDKIQVLIVDDQRLVREGIASILDIQDGITVIGTADNGVTGTKAAMDARPDIILMDIRMPCPGWDPGDRGASQEGFLRQDHHAHDLR